MVRSRRPNGRRRGVWPWVGSLSLVGLGDALVTYHGIATGAFVELNPFYRFLIDTLGLYGGLLSMVVCGTVGVVLAVEAAGNVVAYVTPALAPRVRRVAYGFAIGLGVFAILWNLAILGLGG